MSASPSKPRPLSPFMIGPYYRPQITSVLSITHRITGLLLSAGALMLAWWLVATASGPDDYRRFVAIAGGPLGKLVALGLIFSLSFHFANGIRHLLWDAGVGLDIRKAVTSGWLVVAFTVVATAVIGAVALLGVGA